jgi:hypothetical protein
LIFYIKQPNNMKGYSLSAQNNIITFHAIQSQKRIKTYSKITAAYIIMPLLLFSGWIFLKKCPHAPHTMMKATCLDRTHSLNLLGFFPVYCFIALLR